jgi:transposase
MAKKYNQDFKDMLIELHAASKGPGELSKDTELHELVIQLTNDIIS